MKFLFIKDVPVHKAPAASRACVTVREEMQKTFKYLLQVHKQSPFMVM